MNADTPKGICCSGENKGLMYEKGKECPDGFQFREASCDCIECADQGDLSQCAERGYPPCYICDNGQCVPGPLCCEGGDGVQAYEDRCDVRNISPNCCGARTKVYILERTYEYKHSWTGHGENYCPRTRTVTERFFIRALECQELIFLCNPVTIGHSTNSPSCRSFIFGSQTCSCTRICDAFPGRCDPSVETEQCEAVLRNPDGSYSRPGGFDPNYFGRYPKLIEKYGTVSPSPFRYQGCCIFQYNMPIYRNYEFKSTFVIAAGYRGQFAPNAGPFTVKVDSLCADGLYNCGCTLSYEHFNVVNGEACYSGRRGCGPCSNPKFSAGQPNPNIPPDSTDRTLCR